MRDSARVQGGYQPPWTHRRLSQAVTCHNNRGCGFASDPSRATGGLSGSREFCDFYFCIFSDDPPKRLDVLDIERQGPKTTPNKTATVEIYVQGSRDLLVTPGHSTLEVNYGA